MDSLTPVNITRYSFSNDTTPLFYNHTPRFGLLSHSPYSPLQALLIGLVLFTIIIVTIVGNILVCIAVCIVRKLRRPCNYLLVSLAVSDLCVAILVMPMALLYEVMGKWNFGFMMCNLWVSFDVLSCTASILNLCMISVDRYYAITKPLEYGVKRTPKRMMLCVIFVWLGAACISLPPLIVLGNDYREDNGVSFCSVCQNYGYQIYATLGSFYIPLTVMITVYYKIFCAARKIVAEERRAQSHIIMEHCYLQIHNNSSPATNSNRGNNTHRTSTTSTNTTCSGGATSQIVNTDPSAKPEYAIPIIPSAIPPSSFSGGGFSKRLFKCFPSRKSNESQCPMLASKAAVNNNNGPSNVQYTLETKLRKKMQTNNLHQTTKKLRFQLAKERKASTTLGIIMSAFTICWLPFFVLALIRPFISTPEAIPHSISSFFLWLGYANSLLNPVIYATLNRDFRKPFQQILYFKCSSLNHMMREEFYHSQYGDPTHEIRSDHEFDPSDLEHHFSDQDQVNNNQVSQVGVGPVNGNSTSLTGLDMDNRESFL